MTKKEFIKAISEKAGVTQQAAAKTVDALAEVVREALAAGDEIRLPGFGTFRTKVRPAGKGRNFNGDVIEFPSRRVPLFRPGTDLKKAVQQAN